MKKLRLTPAKASIFFAVSILISVAGILVLMLIPCSQIQMAGVHKDNRLRRFSLWNVKYLVHQKMSDGLSVWEIHVDVCSVNCETAEQACTCRFETVHIYVSFFQYWRRFTLQFKLLVQPDEFSASVRCRWEVLLLGLPRGMFRWSGKQGFFLLFKFFTKLPSPFVIFLCCCDPTSKQQWPKLAFRKAFMIVFWSCHFWDIWAMWMHQDRRQPARDVWLLWGIVQECDPLCNPLLHHDIRWFSWWSSRHGAVAAVIHLPLSFSFVCLSNGTLLINCFWQFWIKKFCFLQGCGGKAEGSCAWSDWSFHQCFRYTQLHKYFSNLFGPWGSRNVWFSTFDFVPSCYETAKCFQFRANDSGTKNKNICFAHFRICARTRDLRKPVWFFLPVVGETVHRDRCLSPLWYRTVSIQVAWRHRLLFVSRTDFRHRDVFFGSQNGHINGWQRRTEVGKQKVDLREKKIQEFSKTILNWWILPFLCRKRKTLGCCEEELLVVARNLLQWKSVRLLLTFKLKSALNV